MDGGRLSGSGCLPSRTVQRGQCHVWFGGREGREPLQQVDSCAGPVLRDSPVLTVSVGKRLLGMLSRVRALSGISFRTASSPTRKSVPCPKVAPASSHVTGPGSHLARWLGARGPCLQPSASRGGPLRACAEPARPRSTGSHVPAAASNTRADDGRRSVLTPEHLRYFFIKYVFMDF